MERLLHRTACALSDAFDVTLIGPTGASRHAPAGVEVLECPHHPVLFILSALLRGTRLCLQRRFSYVFGGSGLVAPVSFLLAKIARGESVVYVHGLDLVARSFIYQKLFVPWVSRHDTVLTNSRNTSRIAVEKGCSESQLRLLHPGTDTSSRPTEPPQTDTKGGPIVLFVGRILARKGLSPFLRNSWPTIVAKEPESRLVVVGDSPNSAVSPDPVELETALRIIAQTELSHTVHFAGAVNDEQLFCHYAVADVLVFPVIEVEGDVEGFGMVAIEAASFGTPTVAFDAGGVSDAVQDGVSGRLVNAGDYSDFAEAVLEVAAGNGTWRDSCRRHAESFGWDRYKQRLLELLPVS